MIDWTKNHKIFMYYAELQLTHESFRLWKWQVFTTDVFSIGPFDTKTQCQGVMEGLVRLVSELCRDKNFIVRWEELSSRPKSLIVLPSDAVDTVAYFISEW